MKVCQEVPLLLRDFVSALGSLGDDPLNLEIASGALTRLVRAFGAGAGGYFVRNQPEAGLTALAEAGEAEDLLVMRSEGQSAAGLAMSQGMALICEAGDSSLLCAPFSLAGQTRAALVLSRREGQGGPFTAVDQAVLQGFIEVLSRGLGRTRLEGRVASLSKELEHRDFRLFTINHMARVLGSVLEMEDLLGLLSDMVCEIITAGSAVVCLYHEEDGMVRAGTAKILGSTRTIEFELPLVDPFLDWVRTFEGRTSPVVSPADPRVVEAFPALSQELQRQELVFFTPLVYKERFMGLLAVGSKYAGGPYSERDQEFLSTLAPLASNAISNAHLYDLAIHDTTTGLYMGHYFRQRVTEEVKRARRYGFPVSVIMLDLDYFKRVNDTYGHLTGDQVLRELAGVLIAGSRHDIDVVARYGGEEFVILLPETPLEGAIAVAERIRKAVLRHPFDRGRISLTISSGVASMPEDAVACEDLLEQADIHLYRAKGAGRNCVYSRNGEHPSP